ncbi:MlaD family protein [Vampirovibrio sp.]|uniref:MlaD family protein n=1 Tax=Vampirovibrio sp. TaxID=2717857 RepID=UPI0035936D07
MFTSLRKSINQKVSLNRAIISDILLWITLAGLLAYGAYLMVIAIPNHRGQTIHLEFRNANEISRGAPVRLMGTAIGFVDDVRIQQDHVRITVQTDPGAVKIPSGSVFTILFTGLGGAKSIEVSLPAKPVPEVDGEPIYRVIEPISMRDTLNASLDSVEALQKGSENISDFFGKRKPVEELQFNIKQALQMSNVANRNTVALNQGLGSMRKDINTYSQMGVETIQSFNYGAKILNQSTQPAKIRPRILAASHNMQAVHDAFVSQGRLTAKIPARLHQFSAMNNQISIRLGMMGQKLNALALPQWLQDFENGQNNIHATLDHLDAFFATDRSGDLEQARNNVKQFNRQLIQWNAKTSEWEREGLLQPNPPSPPIPPSSPQGLRTLPAESSAVAFSHPKQAAMLPNKREHEPTTAPGNKPPSRDLAETTSQLNPLVRAFQMAGELIVFLFS